MKISIFHANAGAGHKKVAEVIEKALLRRGLDRSSVALEDALDSAPFWFRGSYPAIYFHSVKNTPDLWGWFYEKFDRPQIYRAVHPLRTFSNRLVGSRLLARVIRENPDVILTTHFYSAELFARAKREGKIRARLITVITDFLPHSFWINRGTDTYWVMCEETAQALLQRGVPRSAIITGGIPVDEVFKPAGRRREIQEHHGFEPGRLTLLLTSGSFGLGPQKEILRALEPLKNQIQCFVVCGNNQELKAELERQNYSFPVRIFGFVNFMAELMEASDLMVAKSGGSTTTESLVKGIPMVVMQPIPGQESRNAEILKQRSASFFMHEPFQIHLIVQLILSQPEILAAKKIEILKLARPNAAEDLVSFVLDGRVPL